MDRRTEKREDEGCLNVGKVGNEKRRNRRDREELKQQWKPDRMLKLRVKERKYNKEVRQ